MNRTIPATVTAIVLAAVANWLADWRCLLLLLSSLVVYLLVRAPANVTTLPVDAGDHQQTQAEVEQLSRETLSMVKQQLLLVDEENRQVASWSTMRSANSVTASTRLVRRRYSSNKY